MSSVAGVGDLPASVYVALAVAGGAIAWHYINVTGGKASEETTTWIEHAADGSRIETSTTKVDYGFSETLASLIGNFALWAT